MVVVVEAGFVWTPDDGQSLGPKELRLPQPGRDVWPL